MGEILVVNTGPLIALERMGCLEPIGTLPFEFVTPPEVRAELDEGERVGLPRIAPASLRVRALASPRPAAGLAELDRGESAVIQLALELRAAAVAIDEWKGRRVALAHGLSVTGSLGLLGRARQLGMVPAARPFIQRALDAGIRYHPAVVAAVLKELGEE